MTHRVAMHSVTASAWAPACAPKTCFKKFRFRSGGWMGMVGGAGGVWGRGDGSWDAGCVVKLGALFE